MMDQIYHVLSVAALLLSNSNTDVIDNYSYRLWGRRPWRKRKRWQAYTRRWRRLLPQRILSTLKEKKKHI